MINKFKNTKSYLDNFSQEIVKLLKIEIGRSRRRRSMNPRGKNVTAPIDSTGELKDSIKSISKEQPSKISYNIEIYQGLQKEIPVMHTSKSVPQLLDGKTSKKQSC